MFKLNLNASGRDSQRRRAYRSEDKARRAMPVSHDVSTPALLSAKVREMMTSDWMRTNYPTSVNDGGVPKIQFSRRRGGACAGRYSMTFGVNSFAMHMLVVCHELAHTINRREAGRWDSCVVGDDGHRYDSGVAAMSAGCADFLLHQLVGHGPEWAAIYLQLVRQFMGYEHWRILRAQFDADGVRYGDPVAQAMGRIRGAAQSARVPLKTRQSSRNSNPSVRAEVRVTGGHLERPTIYPSVRVAFAALNLPMNQHQKFRKELKLNGINQIGAFTFTTISK